MDPIVAAALIGIVGYFISGHLKRKHELFKRKIDAYINFINAIEKNIPEKTKVTLADNTKIREMNCALNKLILNAPPKVIIDIHDTLFGENKNIKLDRGSIQEIQLILAKDIHEHCDTVLEKKHMMRFPFK